MSNEPFYVAIHEFTDKGVEVICSDSIPFLSKSELTTIGNYYSVILGGSKSEQKPKGLLFGPLPLAYHHEWLSLIHATYIRDPTLRDPRAARNEYMTSCFVQIIFPVMKDKIFTEARESIQIVIDDWFQNIQEVSHITINALEKLKIQLLRVIQAEEVKIEKKSIDESIKVLVGKNIEFLDYVGRSLNRHLRIGIFGTENTVMTLFRTAMHQYFEELLSFSTSDDGMIMTCRFNRLFMDGGVLKHKSDVQYLRKLPSLTHTNHWKTRPKFLDGAMFIFDANNDKTLIHSLIREGNAICFEDAPLSLILLHDDSSDQKPEELFIKLGITEIIATLPERTISLLDVPTSTRMERLGIALIDFTEKVVESLQQA